MQLLMDNLIDTLNGPRIDVHKHQLDSVVESTLRNINSDDDPELRVCLVILVLLSVPPACS